jgi:diguanylate cyclase (GGDEF)-like protein
MPIRLKHHHISTGGAMSEESGKKQRLLIVDDSKVIRVTARKILQDYFKTVEAVDGENAWEILGSEEPFSLIVSDLTMPKLDGFGLLERIRSSHLPHVQNIPVIVITGSNDSEAVKERATSAGATDFIGKPFDSVDLLARTQALASAHTTVQTLTEETIALEERITTDPSSGLANEQAFMGHGYQQLSYAVRHKTSLAVFRIEIDDFGDLYKSYGQAISESIVKAVATVLQSGVRHEDMAARIGTARFALLLPGMNRTGIRNLADRINRDIGARILKSGKTRIRFTVSIGVAAPDILRDTRFDELLSIADSRLVYAMSRGGNQVILEGAENEVPLPQNIRTPEETAPLVLEEAVTSVPEPAESELQLEEIEIIELDETPDEITDEIALSENQHPAVECRAVTAPENQPAKFAGPVPDMAVACANEAATVTGSAPVREATRIPVDTQETAQEPTPVAIPERVMEETIIIGVPGSDFLPYEHKTESPLPPVTSDENASVVKADTSPAANDGHSAAPHDPEVKKRPGFFRRLLNGTGSIFRRSGKS